MNRIQSKLIHDRAHASGQGFFKWVAVLAVVAAAAAGYFLYAGNQAHQAELERLHAEHQQDLARQTEELDRLRNENKEIERLRAGSQEIAKLRGEAAQLRTLQQEQQKLQAENQQLRSTVQQFQQVKTEMSTLQNQNQQLQGALAGRDSAIACVANLRMLESVKAKWAADLRKQPTDMPIDADLFGPGKYVPQKPACPAGGVYTLGPVLAKPTCSAPGHAY
jgi:predicted RNase H-like nuclease (RuvC/YqgF family)